ncbi:hydroxymethylbilane synthase [Altererythrobacter aerius]|uniref:Porphobilinogen deaminase n=1 Tax=Tsuneonella aeria TaxID=1837929 RepID=A0A6I4T9R8_9SPHN|nr:hydroxymethylbilane synthase [Tsuneonella aeria]MXO74269.1 hydroxymethylbilane synthase [Tsuneonella aeria]
MSQPLSASPSTVKPLRLGTRRSPLAMAQAHEARARLAKAWGWDENLIELVPVLASGDKVQDRPLAEIGGKALWTKELDACLADGRIDLAVHSLKDVETIRPSDIYIGAVLPRADVRDVLLGAPSIRAIPEGARVGTSAPRRAAQMLHRRPDVSIVPFRGNVATRMAKLAAGEADVTLLAAAGLERLGESGVGTPLALDDWLPAPSQGAIAIECRAGDRQVREWLAAIDHAPSRAEVMAERALLAGLGGSCHSPIAVLTRHVGDHLAIRCAIYSADGLEMVEATVTAAVGDDEAPRRLAADLLARASPAIGALFAGPE